MGVFMQDFAFEMLRDYGKINRSILLDLEKYAGFFKVRGWVGKWKKIKVGEASWGIIRRIQFEMGGNFRVWSLFSSRSFPSGRIQGKERNTKM